MKKTLQTNVAMNDPYDIRLCWARVVQCHTDHLPQSWSKVFLSFTKMFRCCDRYTFVFHSYFTRY